MNPAGETPMLDFETELEKLLAGEQEPLPQYELAEVLAEGRNLLETLNKKQTDLSLQVEEIYDLAKEADTRELREVLNAERDRLNKLVGAAVGLSDMLEHFCVYAEQSGSAELEHQGRLLWQNSRLLLESCGITRLGEAGQILDPAVHTVQAAVASELPREHVARVLQSGYRYLGMVLRKAVVMVSTGIDHTEIEDADIENEEIENTEPDDMDFEDERVEDTVIENTEIEDMEPDDMDFEDDRVEDTVIENTEIEDMEPDTTEMEETEDEQNSRY
jgi:molecular chaperone GrpE (heat shock protein)